MSILTVLWHIWSTYLGKLLSIYSWLSRTVLKPSTGEVNQVLLCNCLFPIDLPYRSVIKTFHAFNYGAIQPPISAGRCHTLTFKAMRAVSKWDNRVTEQKLSRKLREIDFQGISVCAAARVHVCLRHFSEGWEVMCNVPFTVVSESCVLGCAVVCFSSVNSWLSWTSRKKQKLLNFFLMVIYAKFYFWSVLTVLMPYLSEVL